MKVLIVFVALTLVFSMFLVYIEDMNVYVRLQKELKILAEDCALAGCLSLDESLGYIKEQDARQCAEGIIAKSGLREKGEIKIEEIHVVKDGLGVEITLSLSKSDFFRLPFLSKKVLKRKTEYAWE